MKTEENKTIYLRNYEATSYLIEEVDLTFDLHSTKTKVISKMKMSKRSKGESADLVLNGEEIILESVAIDGEVLPSSSYHIKENTLVLADPGKDHFTLEIRNEVNPEANKALDGLYKSGSIFCTQNEAEGFRRITYFLDRPDVMAVFTTKIIADKKDYPVLLSNGNLIDKGDLDQGKHWATWKDPFPKPCYLYALVAGDLGMIADEYTTASGRLVKLEIYCDKGNESRCYHAMESLKKSMQWDEEKFGLEYDLDIYMIVAVDSFNMGAMENKGLNIFNSQFVLADQKTATDSDFLGVESVIGHEYFHNWTGNRVTCRDWFQLTLKEGLTVYRDQEFSADLNSRVVQRVNDVDVLRAAQFKEDAGPTSHPIKPASYIEINNFYTPTIYNKGAEVIRMIEKYLGRDGFRKGMDKYFELYDGMAVTTEDFVHAMSVANDNFDFDQFKRWYSQAGTPTVQVAESFTDGEYQVTIKQVLTDSPGQPAADKKPQQFPLFYGLLNQKGEEVVTGSLDIDDYEQSFKFACEEKPILSLNREFSAPVTVQMERSLDDRLFLMAYDSDGFNRVEAGTRACFAMIESLRQGKGVSPLYLDAFGKVLADNKIDAAYKNLMISIPAEVLIELEYDIVDPVEITNLREELYRNIVKAYGREMLSLYEDMEEPEFKFNGECVGKRSLRATLLAYFARSEDENLHKVIWQHFETANNMTDEFESLKSLSILGGELWSKASEQFYRKYKDNTLVMQKWLAVCASVTREDMPTFMSELEANEVYDNNIPNLVRSLWGHFMRNNLELHHKSGRGYEMMADKVLEIDKINPQMASRLASAFGSYKRLKAENQKMMKVQLEKIMATSDLSKNVFEIVDLTLRS